MVTGRGFLAVRRHMVAPGAYRTIRNTKKLIGECHPAERWDRLHAVRSAASLEIQERSRRSSVARRAVQVPCGSRRDEGGLAERA